MPILDRLVAFVQIPSSTLSEVNKQVLLSLRGFADGDDDLTAEQSTEDVVYNGATIFRPRARNVDGVAEGLALRASDDMPVFALRDLRVAKRYPPKDGDAALAHDAGGFISFTDNGDVVENASHKRKGLSKGSTAILFAPALDDDGNVVSSHALILDSSEDNSSVVLAHALGNALILGKDGAATIKSANGENFISVSDDGVALSGLFQAVTSLVGGDATTAQNAVIASPVQLPWFAQVTALLNALVAIHTAAPPGTPLVTIAAGPAIPPVTAPPPVVSTMLKGSP